ncbi:MAG: hypothetical protein ACK5LV_06550 [Lachnospirales bacterium]
MRRYYPKNKGHKKVCNMCSKSCNSTSFLKVQNRWDYPSKYDNEIHSFILCENCYDKITSDFKIPMGISNKL